MTRKLIVAAALIAAAVPTAQAAAATETDAKNAAKHCKALKTAAGSAENFRSAIDALTTAKVTTKNAYGKCVSIHTKDEEAERAKARKAAKEACKDEPKKGGAYGKCVAAAAKAKKAEADDNDADKVNAAKFCRTNAEERAKYKNFGQCVSTNAKKAAAERKAAKGS